MTKKLYKLMDWAEIEAIVYSEEDKPHDILGAHVTSSGILVQAFFPSVKKVYVVFKSGNTSKEYNMELADDEGFYAALIPITKALTKYSYFFRVVGLDGVIKEVEDPYNFDSTIDEESLRRFNAGICYDIYNYLGAHVRKIKGTKGVSFAVWAPNAIRVSVVGDFNKWDGRIHQMRRLGDSGVFEIFIPDVKDGDIYKYEVKFKGGMIALKSDPYGFFSELRPDNASIVKDISSFKWTDELFIDYRRDVNSNDKPISIYEVHLGSIYKNEDGSFMNYKELAHKIADYVLDMGYTHVELMPVMEHQNDDTLGYQTSGYYSVTSRYGTPEDFMYFVNYMHNNGIAVILDWSPAHFPKDDNGLSYFDGTFLYEHEDDRKRYHGDFGTLLFNYGRNEVSNYLIANALFWINEYHADAIKMDSVASMLYLDYGKQNGNYACNIYGGNENLEAVEFIKHLNSINNFMETGSLIIAEELTAWPKVTGDLNDDGLGFSYKTNNGWKNDFLAFMGYDPYFRAYHYNELTFSMIYAYTEKFILSFSHDDVMNGKGSILSKMPGKIKDKFANIRAAYGYMFTHPGKKMLFMGQDLAGFDEWKNSDEIDWDLLNYKEHSELNLYTKDLLALYKKHPALYECDDTPDGFEWINNISANENIIVFLRKSQDNGEILLVVVNFANTSYDNYKIGVPFKGKYKEIFNSDKDIYGGKNLINPRVKPSKNDECDGRTNSIRIKIAPLSMLIFRCDEE